jgi:hypothetical protein
LSISIEGVRVASIARLSSAELPCKGRDQPREIAAADHLLCELRRFTQAWGPESVLLSGLLPRHLVEGLARREGISHAQPT